LDRDRLQPDRSTISAITRAAADGIGSFAALSTTEVAMRWVYLIIVIVFVAALVIFGVQNLQTATMSFLGFSVSAPLVVLAVVVYVLGAITGGSLYALLRKSVRESRGNASAR
jgi:lipopolysaccharide assembly protein A